MKKSILLFFLVTGFFSFIIKPMMPKEPEEPIEENASYLSEILPDEIKLVILQQIAHQSSLFDALKTLQQLSATNHQFSELIFKDSQLNKKLIQELLPFIQNKSFIELVKEYEDMLYQEIPLTTYFKTGYNILKPVSKAFREFYAQLLYTKFNYPMPDILAALSDQAALDASKLFLKFPIPGVVESDFFQNIKKGNLARVYALIKAGFDINQPPYIYRSTTPLIFATKIGNKEMVALLLEEGAHPNFGDADYKTAFDYALEQNNPELIDIIESNGGKKAEFVWPI